MSISNSGSDERGKYSGGVAGDQTGKEWVVRSWYNRPWNCVLRHENPAVREKLAFLGEAAAANDNIGYDQGQRDSYWQQLQKAGYDPSKIATACESDCSAGVIANTKATGYLLGIEALQKISATYTGNMRSAYKAAGFAVLEDSKYLTGDAYLLRGDILLNDAHHVATNLTTGSKSSAPGWHQDEKGWWYQYADGSWPAAEWAWLADSSAPDGAWYRFDDEGYMLADTTETIKGITYTFDSNGHIINQKEESTVGKYYTDVNDSAWYAEAVNYAKENGLMQGIGDNKFDPLRSVTRGELAEALMNLHKAIKLQ